MTNKTLLSTVVLASMAQFAAAGNAGEQSHPNIILIPRTDICRLPDYRRSPQSKRICDLYEWEMASDSTGRIR